MDRTMDLFSRSPRRREVRRAGRQLAEAGPLRDRVATSLVRARLVTSPGFWAERPARLRERDAPPEEIGSMARTATASPRREWRAVASGRRRGSRGSPPAIARRDSNVHRWRRRARRRSRVETRARHATPTAGLSGSGEQLDRTCRLLVRRQRLPRDGLIAGALLRRQRTRARPGRTPVAGGPRRSAAATSAARLCAQAGAVPRAGCRRTGGTAPGAPALV
jgi:hypothetical protein